MAKYLNLKKLRQSLGLSQTQLSSEIGLAQGYISELEKGKKQISEEFISKLRNHYGVEIVDQWIEDSPIVQQTIEGDGTGFTGTGNVTIQGEDKIPMEAFNKMLDEIAEQRKVVSKSQEQIDKLLKLLESNRFPPKNDME